MDTALAEWLAPLPCLDAVEQEASEAEILQDPELGTSPDERAAALGRGRRIARITNLVATAVALWGFFYPAPYELAVAAQIAMPWAALWIMRRPRGLLRADESPNDAHPSVALAFMLPGGVLLLRFLLDYDFVNWLAVTWYAVAVGLLLWWTTRSADLSIRKKRLSGIAFAVFSLAYGYGVTLQANTLLDRSPKTEYSVHVKGKRISSGRSVTRHLLEVEAWIPGSKPLELQVSRVTYDHIRRGDVVRLVVRNGALGAPWYYMRAWDRGESNARVPDYNPGRQ